MEKHTKTIDAFFEGLSSGSLSRDLFSSEAEASTATSGAMTIERYLGAARILPAVFVEGLKFERLGTTSQDSRTVVEMRSTGVFESGEHYANTYLFLFEFEGELISRVAEYFDVRPVQSQLVPAIQKFMAAREAAS